MLKQVEAKLSAWGVDWVQFKLFTHHASGISHDAMHVIGGVVAQIALAAVFRSSLAQLWPWAAVLLVELVNEWNDLHVERWPDPGQQWGEGAKDLALTMFLPTLLLVLARWKPAIFERRVADSGNPESAADQSDC